MASAGYRRQYASGAWWQKVLSWKGGTKVLVGWKMLVTTCERAAAGLAEPDSEVD